MIKYAERHGGGRIIALSDRQPMLSDTVFVAPGAVLIGDVEMAPYSSVWFNAVVRGDVGAIRIGERTNIQDGAIVHLSKRDIPTVIGSDVLIGHAAIIHGCTINDEGFVGFGAVVMDGCQIGSNAMLAAGAMLTPGKVMGAGELWGGRPARFMRLLSIDEIAANRANVASYAANAQHYLQALSGPDDS